MLTAACTGGGRGNGDSSPTTTPPPASTTATTTDPSPSPSRTGPLTTGPNVRPGEQPPGLPDAAKEHSSAGALLFAGYYFKALDWSIATNDPFLVQAISASTCQACRRVIDGFRDLRARNAHLKGGRISLKTAKLVTGSFKFESDYVVQVTLTEEAEVLVPPTAKPTSVAPKTTDNSLVFVSFASERWQVIEVGAPS
jgi:hypothetical protein